MTSRFPVFLSKKHIQMKYLKNYGISALLLIASFIYSCSVAPDCTTTDDMEEFETLESTEDMVIYDSIFLLPHTLDESVMLGQEYRIDDDSTYQALFPDESCGDCRLPPINLDTHTLIGKYLQEPCLGIFTRKFVKIDEQNYRFLIKVIQDNRCVTATCLNFSFNFIAVPKLPEDANINVEVGRSVTECDC